MPQLQAVPAFTPPEDRERQAGFDDWLAGLSLAQLRCWYRHRHEFPALDDARTSLHVDQRQGVVEQECDCASCGTHIRVIWGLDDEFLLGLPGAAPQYEYDEGYCFGHAMTADQRQAMKIEYRRRCLAEKNIKRTGKQRTTRRA